MNHQTIQYAQALFVAYNAPLHEDDISVVTEATERLRSIAPDQEMLPALDAKIARMRVIRDLLNRALAGLKNDQP